MRVRSRDSAKARPPSGALAMESSRLGALRQKRPGGTWMGGRKKDAADAAVGCAMHWRIHGCAICARKVGRPETMSQAALRIARAAMARKPIVRRRMPRSLPMRDAPLAIPTACARWLGELRRMVRGGAAAEQIHRVGEAVQRER